MTMRILVLDDDVPVGELLVQALTEAGYEASHVAEGAQAIKAIQARGADLVVVDMHMPGMDGLEFMSRLRRLRPKIRIIGISGGDPSSEVDLLRMSARLGAHATLAKPFTIGEFVSKVRELAPVA
jgi:DNA-binding response OmpR family regulator